MMYINKAEALEKAKETLDKESDIQLAMKIVDIVNDVYIKGFEAGVQGVKDIDRKTKEIL